jgi:hypothetical protein
MTVRPFYFYVLNYRPVDSLFSVLNVARAGFPKFFWVDLKDSTGNYDFSSRFQSIFVTLVLDQEMLIRNNHCRLGRRQFKNSALAFCPPSQSPNFIRRLFLKKKKAQQRSCGRSAPAVAQGNRLFKPRSGLFSFLEA